MCLLFQSDVTIFLDDKRLPVNDSKTKYHRRREVNATVQPHDVTRLKCVVREDKYSNTTQTCRFTEDMQKNVPTKEPPKNNSRKQKIAIGVTAVVGVVFIIISIYIIYNKRQNNKQKANGSAAINYDPVMISEAEATCNINQSDSQV